MKNKAWNVEYNDTIRTFLPDITNYGDYKGEVCVVELVKKWATCIVYYIDKSTQAYTNIHILEIVGPTQMHGSVLSMVSTGECHVTYDLNGSLSMSDTEDRGYDDLGSKGRMGYGSYKLVEEWSLDECMDVIGDKGFLLSRPLVATLKRYKLELAGEVAYIAYSSKRLMHLSGTSLLVMNELLSNPWIRYFKYADESVSNDEETLKLLDVWGIKLCK